MNKTKLLVIIIITAAAGLSYFSAWNDSLIVDEVPHIGAGYSYVAKGDYRLNPEHPPLAKLLAGLALSGFNFNKNIFQSPTWQTNVNDQWYFGRNLIYNSGVDGQLVTRVAKLPMLVFLILSAWIVYRWATELYGRRAGLVALVLFSFSPAVLAHSRFVTTDMAALFGILVAGYTFSKFLANPQSKKYLLLAAIGLGLALLAKFSTFLIIPLFLVISLFSKKPAVILKTVLVVAGAFVLMVWPVYALLVQNYPPEKQQSDAAQILAGYSNRTLANLIITDSAVPVIRPLAQYALGLAMVAQRSSGGNTAFFNGTNYYLGLKKYFPTVYFIKEPLPFWILVGLAIFSIAITHQSWTTEDKFKKWSLVFLLGWLVVYWYTSITSKLNIGVRHLLPVYGPTYILVAGAISSKLKSQKTKIIIGALLLWYVLEVIFTFPHYLAYFNQTVGGAAGGHKVVADSNLDWGQDLKRLADWVDENNISIINLDYFGWADQSYYLKNKFRWIVGGQYSSKEAFLKENPSGGYVAISATFYTQANAINGDKERNYKWLESETLFTTIGHSIFVWYIK